MLLFSSIALRLFLFLLLLIYYLAVSYTYMPICIVSWWHSSLISPLLTPSICADHPCYTLGVVSFSTAWVTHQWLQHRIEWFPPPYRCSAGLGTILQVPPLSMMNVKPLNLGQTLIRQTQSSSDTFRSMFLKQYFITPLLTTWPSKSQGRSQRGKRRNAKFGCAIFLWLYSLRLWACGSTTMDILISLRELISLDSHPEFHTHLCWPIVPSSS